MDYTFDRAEGELAVLISLEDNSVMNIKLEKLKDASEGDIVRINEGNILILKPESEKRRLSISERFNRLKKKD